MNKLALVACLVTIALAGCRREEVQSVYEPMKLGGALHPQEK
ncbi:MAG: hypothetical protein NW216_07905 [Hyphomicrobium sp.]|nr:hypothetical protein [Hyphomicrobium sp.]